MVRQSEEDQVAKTRKVVAAAELKARSARENVRLKKQQKWPVNGGLLRA